MDIAGAKWARVERERARGTRPSTLRQGAASSISAPSLTCADHPRAASRRTRRRLPASMTVLTPRSATPPEVVNVRGHEKVPVYGRV